MGKISRPNFLEAAIAVLSAARQPLTVTEITKLAIERGFLVTSGKTPRATMSAALYKRPALVKEAGLVRVFEPGHRRATRGSVRWKLVRRS
jgi:hypothetical protein